MAKALEVPLSFIIILILFLIIVFIIFIWQSGNVNKFGNILHFYGHNLTGNLSGGKVEVL